MYIIDTFDVKGRIAIADLLCLDQYVNRKCHPDAFDIRHSSLEESGGRTIKVTISVVDFFEVDTTFMHLNLCGNKKLLMF
ncbi:4735_t:CDS:2 [Dentiscutata heterogama]|uniref:4735_t:CDS:1 n=1 Tax=Dentiscutata heterogama TaxID=1316150 RepID=A0ACA9L2U8_9GLOM|nr:4735_t:CDS:2 [Dentiscutata heterogama]